MDDRHTAVQPTARAKARRVPADGIIGRLTYTPAQGDEIPTSQPSDMGPSQVAKHQKQWLLGHLSEASILDEGVESLLLEEIAVSQAKSSPALADAPSLFSVGEVADLREGESNKGHPVLAVASGVSGNVLRLISLAREKWVWRAADIRVDVHATNNKLEGNGFQDVVPISLVKFAIDARKYDPIRWLLVQNGASTTVYEPELRAIPMPAGKPLGRVSGTSVASQFFDNPLFTIPCEQTGGSLQADVCFTRQAEADIPRMAIIDQAGYWSVWDVTGRLTSRPKNLTPVLKMCGNSISGSISKLPFNSMNELQPHKILWLARNHETLQSSSRSAKHTRSAIEPSGGHPELEPHPSRQLLLLCSPRNLHVFDPAAQKLHSVSHLVLPKATHRILGIASSRLDPAQAFILTSTTFFWVVVREGKRKSLTLDILVSCPHQKDVNDPTLRLDVSPGAYVNGLMACFVCVPPLRTPR
ncbi:hypothetical protein NEMBOFW57_009891 [Staphylotrichum longicolle]|uniref:RRN6 beta-propeller domain-containing protein n=1 Tax=Staphylotrichum longicolle TaxID=669026 RepID=A0AAD4HWD3_9PEZI|nr:hypothetical protein NEMBOFW57_009891 [Staphylotrichum longicolle]